MNRSRALCAVSLAAWISFTVGGCADYVVRPELVTAARFDRGMTVILPGIEGAGLFSHAVQQGLADAGIHHALPVFHWGSTVPLAGPLLNQVDGVRAHRAARDLARAIVAYRERYPGRPVHLVGHSGGGAIAVFALEYLPANTQVDGAILLSPSLSAEYNLSAALARTRKGIVHFWSQADVALLVVGTIVFGNLDRVHGPAAGARGFTNFDGPADLFAKLHQTAWRPSMVRDGNLGGHMGTTSSEFVAQWVARWIKADIWPPSVATLALARNP